MRYNVIGHLPDGSKFIRPIESNRYSPNFIPTWTNPKKTPNGHPGIKNPKIAANIVMMYNLWRSNKHE